MVKVVSNISGDLTLLLPPRLSLTGLPTVPELGERTSGVIGSGNLEKFSMDWLIAGPCSAQCQYCSFIVKIMRILTFALIISLMAG